VVVVRHALEDVRGKGHARGHRLFLDFVVRLDKKRKEGGTVASHDLQTGGGGKGIALGEERAHYERLRILSQFLQKKGKDCGPERKEKNLK